MSWLSRWPQNFVSVTHREIFSKSYWIKLNSDFIYQFPIDLEQETDTVRLLFQINRCMVNTIWFRFDLIRFGKDFPVFIHTRWIYLYIYIFAARKTNCQTIIPIHKVRLGWLTPIIFLLLVVIIIFGICFFFLLFRLKAVYTK